MTAAQQTKEQQEDGLLSWQTRLRFGAASKLAVDPLEGIGRPQRLPLRLRKPQKGEEIVARFLETLDHSRTSQPPLLRESGARLIDEGSAVGVDHPSVLFGELLAQAHWRLGLEIPELVRGAALNRQRRPLLAPGRRQAGTAVNDGEQRPADLALRQAANNIAPRGRAFIAGQADVEHHALAIGPHAQRDQYRHTDASLADADFRVPAVHQ